jgi:5-oxoprolinase (ATP-hydrolysing)
MQKRGWRFAIDRGGTFTDVLAVTPDGQVRRIKLLSVAPGQYADAVLEGVRRLLDWPRERILSEAPIASVRLGTTVATNALLERRGARVGMLLSSGFADLLLIDDQSRPELFRLDQHRPAPLYAAVAEVSGRIGADGQTLQPLDLASVRACLLDWRAAGIEAIAVSLLHAWVDAGHELAITRLARECGFESVVGGHQISSAARYLDRSHTALIDAYLSPLLRRYLDELEAALGPGRLLLMRSDGVLVPPRRLSGAAAVLSGPAGGVSACLQLARDADEDKAGKALIGFDMGGTSTDVCVIRDRQAARSWREVAGLRLGLPMLEVHTVAAGGGSIIDYREGQLVVGPASAGADPGPACYGRGGPATVSDANLVLGQLLPEALPAVFGAGADAVLDRAAATAALERLCERMAADGQPRLSVEQLARGALALANEAMAQAVHGLTTARGLDPAEAVLNGYGGAAGQHLCAVADRLGVREAWLHPYAGVLSAWGIGLSAEGEYAELPLERPLTLAGLAYAQRQLRQWQGEMRESESARQSARFRVRLEGGGELDFLLPWDGQALPATLESLQGAFARAFADHFGYAPPTAERMLSSLVLERSKPVPVWPVSADAGVPDLPGSSRWHDGEAWHEIPLRSESTLQPGDQLAGPALLIQTLSTLFVAADWQLQVAADGVLQLRRADHLAGAKRARSVAADPVALDSAAAAPVPADPIKLALYHHRFMHLAEQMGEVLQRSARSVNIRERLDYSCALFDRSGQLIANAPHMPVHLGSMGESVRAVLDAAGAELAPGDAWLLNDPYRGGTHLPDITVVSPCFDPAGTLVAILASRAHHADVGGITPGSMPAGSRTVDDEGVLIPPTQIMRGDVPERELVLQLFRSGAYPSRDPFLNLGEIEAQLAANRRGARLFRQLLAEQGEPEVSAYLRHVLDHTESLLRARLRELASDREAGIPATTPRRCTLQNDQGASICVAITIDTGSGDLRVDFSGTSDQLADNYNAPSAVVRAAVLYVLRCLLDHPVPLNEGFARPLRLILPPGSMLAPRSPAAVVAGNVETSQLITDALLLAFGAQAASQGSMNNLSFGNARWQYYETICGGVGAGPGFHGASALHSHMTNSRITDPEVLERRFPLRLECFAVRRGSGGAGQYRGGDGVIRRIRFLEAVELSILAGRRLTAPPGLNGGQAGKGGRTLIIDRDGSERELAYAESVQLQAGDAIEVQTPGGGGCGVVSSARVR